LIISATGIIFPNLSLLTFSDLDTRLSNVKPSPYSNWSRMSGCKLFYISYSNYCRLVLLEPSGTFYYQSSICLLKLFNWSPVNNIVPMCFNLSIYLCASVYTCVFLSVSDILSYSVKSVSTPVIIEKKPLNSLAYLSYF